MQVFRRVEIPRAHRRNGFARQCRWYSWSKELLDLAGDILERGIGKRRLRLIEVRGADPYCYSYTIAGRGPERTDLRRPIAEAARALREFPVGARIACFTGLLEPPVHRLGLRVLIACLRDAIARSARYRMAALYSPLGDTGAEYGEFPLHCDLFVPTRLFNIYDRVPGDRSGAATFMATRELFAALRRTAQAPATVRTRVQRYICGIRRTDRYDELFRLLYGREHPWALPLQRAMRVARQRIAFASGEGYLIDDRAWLHGREAPTGGVSRSRLHRLVFKGV